MAGVCHCAMPSITGRTCTNCPALQPWDPPYRIGDPLPTPATPWQPWKVPTYPSPNTDPLPPVRIYPQPAPQPPEPRTQDINIHIYINGEEVTTDEREEPTGPEEAPSSEEGTA